MNSSHRPGNVRGAPTGEPLGIGFYSALAVLRVQRTALQEQISAAAKLVDPKRPDEKAVRALSELNAEAARVDADILAEELRRDAEINAPTVDPEAARALASGGQELTRFLARRPGAGGAAPDPHTYAGMFGTVELADDGWPSLDDFLATIHNRQADPRLQMATGTASSIVGSDGGFLVPEYYAAMLFDGAIEREIVRPRARPVPMKSREQKISGFSAKTHTGGSIYGFTPVWMEETGTSTDQKPEVVQVNLTAWKLALYASSSNELASDGQSFEEQLGEALRLATGFGLDTAFLTGNGTAKPRGVLNDPALIAVAKETGQAADTILAENIINMESRLHPALFGEAIWVANTTTYKQLSTLSIAIGTGGYPVPLLTGRDGQYQLRGRTCIFTEKLPVVGDLGDIVLAAFSQYAVGMRKEYVLDRSQAPGWHDDLSSWRGIVRVDGRGLWTAPVAPLNGDTLSWCVALAARA